MIFRLPMCNCRSQRDAIVDVMRHQQQRGARLAVEFEASAPSRARRWRSPGCRWVRRPATRPACTTKARAKRHPLLLAARQRARIGASIASPSPTRISISVARSRAPWGTRAAPAAASRFRLRSGWPAVGNSGTRARAWRARSAARSSSSSANRSCPVRRTVPDVGVSNPATMPNNVLLPDPDAPTIAADSRGCSAKAMSWRIVSVPLESRTCLLTPFYGNDRIGHGVASARSARGMGRLRASRPEVVLRRPGDLTRRSWLAHWACACAASLAPCRQCARWPVPTKVLVVGDSLSAEYGWHAAAAGWRCSSSACRRSVSAPPSSTPASAVTPTSGGRTRALLRCSITHKPTHVIIELGQQRRIARPAAEDDRRQPRGHGAGGARQRRAGAVGRHAHATELRAQLHAGVRVDVCDAGQGRRCGRWCRSCWPASPTRPIRRVCSRTTACTRTPRRKRSSSTTFWPVLRGQLR